MFIERYFVTLVNDNCWSYFVTGSAR